MRSSAMTSFAPTSCKQRELILVERVSRLVARLLEQIRAGLQVAVEGYRARHEALLNNQLPDLDGFLAEQKQAHATALRLFPLPSVGPLVRNRGRHVKRKVKEAIAACKDARELQAVVESRLPAILEETHTELRNSLARKQTRIVERAAQELRQFEERFGEAYRDLALTAGDGTAALPQVDLASPVARPDAASGAVQQLAGKVKFATEYAAQERAEVEQVLVRAGYKPS